MAKITKFGGPSDASVVPAAIDSEPPTSAEGESVPEETNETPEASSEALETPVPTSPAKKTVSGKAGVRLPGLQVGNNG